VPGDDLNAPLPWQHEVWTRLRAQLGAGKLHHAVLLSGPGGIGKRVLADALTDALLCEDRTPKGGCGSCRGCVLARAGTHPDLLRVEPEEAGKQIKIDQIRALADFVNKTSSLGSRKVVLIDPADAMNSYAANSLLKSLEEPSPGTHLLLLSSAPGRLLPTIRSRCEHLRLGLPLRAAALEWLRHRGAADADALLEAASGRPLAALELVQVGALARFERVGQVLQQSSAREAWIPQLVAEWSELELRDLLEAMYLVLLDLQRGLAARGAPGCRLSASQHLLEALGARASAGHVARTIRATLRATRDAFSGANPNRQLLLEALLIDWQAGCLD